MIRLVIVDDEQHCISALQYMLKRQAVAYEIAAVFENPLEARKYLEQHEVDLILLDVHMPGMTGLELLESLPNLSAQVVFTTAYDNFALAAFKLNALDYLLKPIEKDDLERALQKYEVRSNEAAFAERLRNLLREVSLPAGQSMRLRMPTAQGFELVDPSQIYRLEADGNYTRVVFQNESKLYTKAIGAIEPLLPTKQFFRTHHSHIVNLDTVVAYQRGKGGEVTLKNGDNVPVARNKRDQLLEIL